MLDEVQHLVKVLDKIPGLYDFMRKGDHVVAESLYCTKCGDARRVSVGVLTARTWPKPIPGRLSTVPTGAAKYVPAMGTFTCVQCSALFTWLLYHSPQGPALAVLASTYAGVSTPNTPQAVAYYLDQAHRAHAVGANSAAVAMYRAALEQLLFDQGFQAGMLHQKIAAFEAAVLAGTAPKWAVDLDADILKSVKDLGNGSIHPNGGDITKQDSLDAALIQEITRMFSYILFLAYDAPLKSAALKASLAAKASIVKK